jgi:hypothetical protein
MSLNSINNLICVMEKCSVLLGTNLNLNIIYMRFVFQNFKFLTLILSLATYTHFNTAKYPVLLWILNPDECIL